MVVVADYDASVAAGEVEDKEEEAEFCCSHLQKELNRIYEGLN